MMNDIAEKIARRLAPLVQEGLIGGHTVRPISPEITSVVVSPFPRSRLPVDRIRAHVEDALRDLEPFVIVEITP